MSLEENDPDTLQLLDESDPDWVKLWRRAQNKNKSTTMDLKFSVIPTQKIRHQSSQLRSRKTL